MISQKYITDLELKGDTIKDFYDYVIDTEINGQYGQLRELINKMSFQQFKEFLYYVEENDIKTDFLRFRGEIRI